MRVIINIEAKAKYAGNFKKLSRESVFSTTCFEKAILWNQKKVNDLNCAIQKYRLFVRQLIYIFAR